MTEKYPLVTFALFTFNQGEFVRDAVEAALSQDYPNLEIIISDDASSDGTWEVIQQTVGRLPDRSNVFLYRNSSNLGVCDHINKVFEYARGELIVVAAGDDISLSCRCTSLTKAWLAGGKPVAALHSGFHILGGGPTSSPRVRTPTAPTWQQFLHSGCQSLINGATGAYSKSLIDEFPPLSTGMVEDLPMTFRALLGGELIYVPEPLIRYRKGEGISRPLRRSDLANARQYFARRQSTLRQIAEDLRHRGRVCPGIQTERHLTHIAALISAYDRGRLLGRNIVRDFFIIMALPLRLRQRIALFLGYTEIYARVRQRIKVLSSAIASE